MSQYNSDVEIADALNASYKRLKTEIGKVIIGQDEIIRLVLTAVFCEGHCLLVGVPGLAKTLLVQTISEVLALDFNRIQFTPDLMPSDILGTETMDREEKVFKFIKGAVFANIVLADEINRTPPKTQAALLEAMQERSVTVGGKAYSLPRPFFVLATQNPIEQEGTYPLPEAQLDRFMFNLWLDYPKYEDEVEIVKRTTTAQKTTINSILTPDQITEFRKLVRRVPVPDNVVEYAVKLVNKTRPTGKYADQITSDFLEWGAGPRASQYLILGAKCNALLDGKYSPDIEDVRTVAVSVLRHRIVRNFKAEAEGITVEKIIKQLF